MQQPESPGAQVRSAGCQEGGDPLAQLSSVVTLEEMRHLPGRCHELTGSRKGQLAVTLHGGFRLIFRPGDREAGGEAGLDWSSVTEIIVTEIVDYH